MTAAEEHRPAPSDPKSPTICISRFGGRNRPPETNGEFLPNRPSSGVSGARLTPRNRPNGGLFAHNGLVVSLRECAWWARQSDRCQSPVKFPANRENNREYSNFRASKSASNARNPRSIGFFDLRCQKRNRELIRPEQGIKSLDQGISGDRAS